MEDLTTNRIKRLAFILTSLSSGAKLSTPHLVEKFNLTKRKVQLDFKEYIIPLFEDKTIYYDYSIKCYVAKRNFLTSSLLSADELAVIAILKAKSKDKYSDKDLAKKTEAIFNKFEDALSNTIYQEAMTEKIDDFKTEIIQIRNAIKSKNEITCTYNDKSRNLYPLKILNLEGYWYLINYDLDYAEIRRYHLNSIKNVELLEDEFEFDDEVIAGFDNAINAYFEPHVKAFAIELFLDKKVAKYFLRKPINKTQRVMKMYDDCSMDVEIYITDFMEIIPTIQRYMPYIGVICPDDLNSIVCYNVTKYVEKDS